MTPQHPTPSTYETYLELLTGGGLILPDPGDDSVADPLPKYNGSLDPEGVERLGAELARAVSASVATRPDIVLVWQDPEDLVLAHVVARELGTSVLRCVDLDGLVGHDQPIPSHATAVIVTDAVRDGSPIRAMTALIKRAGGSVVGVAVLAATTSDIGGVPAITTSAAKAGSEAVAT